MSRPFKLYRLQQIDIKIDSLVARLNEIEEDIKEDQAVRRAREKSENLEKQLDITKKDLRVAEDNVHQQRVKIEQSESTLYGGKVRNPKELQDLQNEVTSLKRYLDVLEERQLEAMLAEEDAHALYKSASEGLDKAREKFAKKQEKLTIEQEKLIKEVDRFKDERNAAAGAVEADDLNQYEQLRKKRRGVAVSKVTDRACASCGTTLNAALLYASHSPNQLTLCDSCGRILYAG